MEVGRFKDMSKLGELTKDWRGGGEGCNTCFSYFKNIQFARSRINLLYLGYGALNNRLTSLAARKEIKWGGRGEEEESSQGQTGNHRFGFPVRICLHLHDYKGLTSYKGTTKFENRGKWDGNKFKCLVKNSKFGN